MGRKMKLPPFVALGRRMLTSKEWRELAPNSKVVYIYLRNKFVGHNNGEIRLYYSELKDMMASATIAKSFKELQVKGWVIRDKLGGLFRNPNVYRLTGTYDEIQRKYSF